MPALISIFLDHSGDDAPARAEWSKRVSRHQAFELLDRDALPRGRAAALQRALHAARGDAFIWIDSQSSVELDPLAHAWETIRLRDAASASLCDDGETLTELGVRVPISGDAGQRLFAPERAAIYDRAKLLAVGGFDATLIEGHEDANIGWRLALGGHHATTVHVMPPPAVRTPTSRIDGARRLRHACANELATLFTCAGDDWLRHALPAALARLLMRACATAQLEPSAFDFGRPHSATYELPVESVALLLAIEDLARALPRLGRRREYVQSHRRRSDDDLFPLFERNPVDPLWMQLAHEPATHLCELMNLTRRGPIARGRPSPPAPDGTAPKVEDTPRVSVIVLTMLGPTHLPACLASLAQLDYPPDAIELIVVDNASAEDPTAVVARHYPAARVLRQERNLGFCGGNNVGASAATFEWLLFLNDDTRVEPGLLRALIATARRRNAASVGAFVVDWEGREVDFAGGLVNFEGRGFQFGVGARDVAAWRRERPLLFGNGAGMLIRRDAYLAAGGFPESYFAYYEDVALGWALWLRGDEVWLSPDALVFHRHHGSSAATGSPARERHFSRNALSTLTTHLEEAHLPDVVAAALLVASTRIVLALGLGGFRQDDLTLATERRVRRLEVLDPLTLLDHARGELRRRGAKRAHGLVGSVARVGVSGVAATIGSLYRFITSGTTAAPSGNLSDSLRIPADAAAALVGIAEWAASAPQLRQKRDALQQARRRTDAEVLGRFSENWLSPVPVDPDREAEYRRTHRAVVRQFRLARVVQRSRP